MSHNWTAAQLRVINSNSDKILVSASSGSGKTTVMIARIVNLILNKKTSIDNILVTTFTNAAAQDMKTKLIDELSKALQTSADKNYLLDQLQSAETAQICTLHSFCADLIRKYYYVAGVDSAFTVIQDLEASLKKSKAVKKVFQEYLDGGDQTFLRVYDIFSRRRKDKKLAEIINRIYDFYRTLPKEPDWLAVPPDLDAVEEYIQDYKRLADGFYIKQLESIRGRAQAIGYEPALKAADCILEGIKTGLFDKSPQQRKPKDCDEETIKFIEKSQKICQKARSFYKDFNDSISKDCYDQEIAAKLLELTAKFAQKYDELKKEDFELDFANLEHCAFEILNNEEVKAEIKQKYKYIFVDEYQDINPMQEAIINLFEGSKMFFVGDVKQSIYRFRLCDPDIFIKKYRNFKSGANPNCEAIDLNDNFRSAKSILDFNNEIFSKIMTTDLGGVNYDKDARFTANNPDLKDEPAVNIVIGKIPPKESVEPDRVYSVKNHVNQTIITSKKAEADIIINEIGKVLESGRVLKDGRIQNPDFSDIVILFRSVNNSLEIISEISKVYPTVSGIETEVLSRPEILMLIDYIKVIDNLYQDISLTGSLKSVFGRLDENELIKIRERYPKTDFYYQAVLEYKKNVKDDISKKLNTFFDNIEQDKKYASCHNLRELLLYIITKYDYEEYLLTYFDQADYEYVELFLDLSSQYKTVQEFLDYIDNGEISPSIEMPADSGSKAIRIMTIHQAKGLEFPIVFLCGLGVKFRHNTDEIFLDQRVKLGLRYYDYQNRLKSESKTRAAVGLRNKQKEIEEEMRVLYVGLTRAKYQLILTGTIKENYRPIGLEPFEILNAQSYLDWILAILSRDKADVWFEESKKFEIKPCYKLEIVNINTIQNRGEFKKPILAASDKELERKIKQNIEFKYQAEDLNQKYTVTELNAPQDFVQSAYIFKEQDSGGIERGNAYHALMKYINFNCQTVEDVNSQIQFLKAQNLLSEDYIKLIDAQKILKVLSSGIITLAQQNKYYREREFLYYADPKDLGLQGSSKVLVQGVIDLIIFTAEGVIIVDYKTTKGDEEHLKNLYKNQLDIYAKAAQDILGENVVKKVIYSFEADKEIFL
jgi:ATP-dependent helicase/nuclease subunit A